MNENRVDMPEWPTPVLDEADAGRLFEGAKAEVAARRRRRRSAAVTAAVLFVVAAGAVSMRTMFYGGAGQGDLRAMLEADVAAHGERGAFAFDSGPADSHREVYDGI
jgi:hypothetical protein